MFTSVKRALSDHELKTIKIVFVWGTLTDTSVRGTARALLLKERCPMVSSTRTEIQFVWEGLI